MKRLLIFFALLAMAVTSQAQVTLKQSATARKLVFLMIDSADHISGKTGLTVTVTLSKNGAAFASPAGTVSEIGSGWYALTATSADTGTLGSLVLHATATGADVSDHEYNVVAPDPDSATVLLNGNGDALLASLAVEYGTAQAGTSTTLQLRAGAPSYDLSGQYIFLQSGTGAKASVATLITAYNTTTKTATVAAWPNGTPDSTTVYQIRPQMAFLVQEHTENAADVMDALNATNTLSPSIGSIFTLLSGVAAPWSSLTSSYTTAGTFGKLLNDNLNATISSRMATFTLPTNFSALAITSGGAVTASGITGIRPYMVYIDNQPAVKASLTFQANDVGVVVQETLRYPNGTPIDLTGKTVNFQLVPITGGSPVVNSAATIAFATGGVAYYTLTGTDLATVGTYYRRWKVTDGSGNIVTYPNTNSLTVVIHN